MSEELLVRHCAPTLAGLKTANLFACRFSDGDALRRCLCCWNRRLTKKGLRILPLRFEGRRALIYVYRPARLACDLRQAAAAVQRQIEIIQGFDAGKTVRRIFAEEAHEAAVPDPDADIAERFVHIRSLGHPRKIQQMIVRQFPGSFIQPVIFGPFIENWFRHLRPPLRVNGKLFSHHYGISSSAASGKWSLEASPP